MDGLFEKENMLNLKKKNRQSGHDIFINWKKSYIMCYNDFFGRETDWSYWQGGQNMNAYFETSANSAPLN